MKTTDILAAAAVFTLLSIPVFAADPPEEKKPAREEDYSFQAGAPASEPLPEVRQGLGDPEDFKYGMTDRVLPGNEMIDQSDALAAQQRHVNEAALQAKDVYVGRNPNSASPDKDRLQLVSGEFVIGNVLKKEMAGVWIVSGGNRSFYLWEDLLRQDRKEKK
ncbi:MAG TPA: hypothetical protein VL404_05790 [Candidatus Eisenbacteria bacterium]|jgi:hypothetical protein|nr:hypothetical protein [Candidatus Eisenbacteria bacterium]